MENWENVLAKLCNPEPTMAQWNVTLVTTKKTRERQQGHFKTLAAASVKMVSVSQPYCQLQMSPLPTRQYPLADEVSLDTIR